jgi:tetratricopeptide (TPR) repeat protein
MLAARPKDASLYFDRGQVHGRQNHWSEAAADYAKAAALKPDDPTLWLACGRAQAKRQQWHEVAACFAKALALLPVNFDPNAPRSTAVLELAAWDKAVAKTIELRPNDAHLHLCLTTYAEQHKKWQQAEASYNRAHELAPDNAVILFGRGDFYASRQLWTKAAADFERGLQIDPSNHWYWYRGAALRLQIGDRAGYRRYCLELLKRFGKSTIINAVERSAKMCLLAPEGIGALPDDVPQPIQLCAQAVTGTEFHSSYVWFELAAGMAQYRAGKYEAAIAWLRKTEPVFRLYNPCFETMAQLFLAMSYQRLGRAAEARKTLAQASKNLDAQQEIWKKDEVDVNWHDWLMCMLVRPEAEAVVKGTAGAKGGTAKRR